LQYAENANGRKLYIAIDRKYNKYNNRAPGENPLYKKNLTRR